MCDSLLINFVNKTNYVTQYRKRTESMAQQSKRRIKKVESYLPADNVFGGIWRSFSGAAYWVVYNSCLGEASPLAKPASTQSQ